MNNLKTYHITATDCDWSTVTLQVDHDVLTTELAAEINGFGVDANWRLGQEDHDVVRVVIRMFGARAIAYLLGIGGADISADADAAREMWTQSVLNSTGEGWPDYSQLGIQIIAANVCAIGYDEVELEDAQ